MLKLARYLKKFKLYVIIGPAFKLIEAIFELIVPLVIKRIIDVGIGTGDTNYVLKMGGVLVLLGIVGLCSTLVCQRSAAIASQGVGTLIRDDMFRHIGTLSHEQLDRIGTPSLITRITSDINQLQVAVAMLIRLVIRAPFLAIGAIIMAMSIDLTISLIFLVSTVLIFLVIFLIMSKSVPFFKSIQKKLDRISLITRENLSGARVIRAFSGENRERTRFKDAADDYTDSAIAVSKLSALLNPLTLVIINLAIAAIILLSGKPVNEGDLTQGDVIALVNYMNQTLQALIVVANLFVIFTKAAASAARVNEVLDCKASIVDALNAAYPSHPAAVRMRFDNVCFRYPDSEENALDNISFEVKKGETVGIIGATGSGKSTIISLIPRFFDVTSGSIEFDGVDIRDLPVKELRAHIGLVPQKSMLISGTIADNLRFGAPDATDDELWRAAEIAQAAEFIRSKPDGMSAPVTQGAKNLSGGQRQRLTIARALASNPELLILDDSASALDFATDAKLRAALGELSRTTELTQIIVSQRVSSIRHADKILVIDDGTLIGTGTHDTLKRDCGVYLEICRSQLREEEL